jgi:GTP cyclohydrolase I
VLEAEQNCLTCRAEKKTRARVVASAFTGAMAKDRELVSRFTAAIAAGLASERETP